MSNRDKKVIRLQEKKITQENEARLYPGLDWAAFEENYFASIFLLDPVVSQALVFKKKSPRNSRTERLRSPYFYLAVSRPQEAFLGPKEYDRLKAYGHQTKKYINFGFFGRYRRMAAGGH